MSVIPVLRSLSGKILFAVSVRFFHRERNRTVESILRQHIHPRSAQLLRQNVGIDPCYNRPQLTLSKARAPCHSQFVL
jgi:hypothetical protein